MLRASRAFFDARDFAEVQVPLRVPNPGMEPHLDAFIVGEAWLHTSPEYALKKALGQGLERVYSLGPAFRDEPASRTHSPEFTMLEWYEVGLDLPGLMDQTEALVGACAAVLSKPLPSFERMRVREAFQRYAGVDPWASPMPLGDYFQCFLDEVEPRLPEACFLWGYPASQAALARIDPADPSTALRFELYLGGLELANAFDELTDPVEQRARFEREQAERRALGTVVYPIDEALLEALGRMRPTCGIALGFDRLLMWLFGAEDIAEVRS